MVPFAKPLKRYGYASAVRARFGRVVHGTFFFQRWSAQALRKLCGSSAYAGCTALSRPVVLYVLDPACERVKLLGWWKGGGIAVRKQRERNHIVRGEKTKQYIAPAPLRTPWGAGRARVVRRGAGETAGKREVRES